MAKEYLPNLVDTLEDSIEKLEYLIESNGEPSEDDEFVDLSADVLENLTNVLKQLERSRDMASVVNWFMTGDDDEDIFLSKMEDI